MKIIITNQWMFLLLLIAAWLVSVSPFSSYIRLILLPINSIGLGLAIGIILYIRNRKMEWIYAILFIVFIEQIFIVSSSFADEIILFIFSLNLLKPIRNTRNPIGYSLLFFLIAFMGSAIINLVNIPVIIAALRSYIQYALMFLIMYHMKINSKDMHGILKLLFFSAVFFSAVGVLNLAIGNITYVGRTEGVLSNPNALAGFLVFVLSLIWVHSSARVGFPWLNQVPLTWLTILLVTVFISTGSRSMITGLFFGLSIITLLSKRNYKLKLKLLGILLVITTAGFVFSENLVVKRFQLLRSETYMSAESNVRMYYLQQGMRLFQENKLAGVGPGRYGGSVATIFLSPVYEEYGILSPRDFWSGVSQGDIFYPHLLAELGVIGVFCFGWLFFGIFSKWLVGVFSGRIRWSVMGAASVASLIAITIANFGGPYFEMHLTAMLYWLFLYILALETNEHSVKRI